LPRSGAVRVIGAFTGLLLGAFGVWGTGVVASDFCSDRSASAAVGSLASSIPANVECFDVLPSLLIGVWLISVGVLSIAASVLELGFADRFERDAALD
jgi:hypothetical protein